MSDRSGVDDGGGATATSVDDESLGVGEALVASLEARGVDVVFGIPGVHTIELYRGLAASTIRHVTPRHEQGAAFMADGYARASGRPGVCLLISGPGLTNALTAMAQARADRVPLLVVSGVNRRETLGCGLGCLHELPDQGALAATVALSTRTLVEPARLDDALDDAFAIACGPRPGPVHLEIPVDVMAARIALPEVGARRDTKVRVGSPEARPSATASNDVAGEVTDSANDGRCDVTEDEKRAFASGVAHAAALCRDARRPLVLAGGGCRRAADALRRLAERLDAPVVCTVNARGVLAGHPLEVPSSPSLVCIRDLIADSDLVVAIGTEMGPTDYDMYERGAMPAPARWLRVDTDPAMLDGEPRATLAVRADAARFADALAAAPEPYRQGTTAEPESKPRDETAGGANDATPGAARACTARQAAREEIGADYRALLDALAGIWRALPDATIVGDSTQPVYAGNLHVEAPRAGAWFNAATGFGTLGYAPGAAIGASLGDVSRPVVCLVGDGGLQFSLAELGSARDVDADVAFVVWNNAGYGEIETAMTTAGVAPVGVTPSAPDFGAVADAYRLPSRRVRDVAALERALVELPRPCLIQFDARAR